MKRLVSSEVLVSLSGSDKVVIGPDVFRRRVILPCANTVVIVFRFGASAAVLSQEQITTGCPPVVIRYEDWGDIITHELHLAASGSLPSYAFWVVREVG